MVPAEWDGRVTTESIALRAPCLAHHVCGKSECVCIDGGCLGRWCAATALWLPCGQSACLFAWLCLTASCQRIFACLLGRQQGRLLAAVLLAFANPAWPQPLKFSLPRPPLHKLPPLHPPSSRAPRVKQPTKELSRPTPPCASPVQSVPGRCRHMPNTISIRAGRAHRMMMPFLAHN